MDAFTIKFIAIICMTLDHVKWFFPNLVNPYTMYFGRVAFPLFAFMIGEGYRHTKNLPKYFLRLTVWGLISVVPFFFIEEKIGQGYKTVNIYATLILGLLAITAFDKFGKKYYLSIPLVALAIYLGHLIKVDYGWYGVAIVFAFYVLKDKKVLSIIIIFILGFLRMMTSDVDLKSPVMITYLIFMTIVPTIVTFFYNGERGFKIKHLFYAFYPLHFCILEILYRIIN